MSSNKICVTCRNYFDTSSPNYGWPAQNYGTSAPNMLKCSVCSEKELQMWGSGLRRYQEDEDTELALQSSLMFLRLPVDRTRGGDVWIVVQGNTHQPLHAHKFILASKSLVLCKMFETDMLKKETGIFRIDDASLPVMHAMVKFCYTVEIDFTEKVTAEEVLAVAHKYGVDLLTKLCERHLITTISKENLPKRLKLARKFEVSDLQRVTSQYFKHNFDSVIDDVLGELC